MTDTKVALDLEALVGQLSILTKEVQVEKIELNWAQREFLAVAQRQLLTTGKIRIIVLKARQLGISTITEALLFTLCFLFNNYKALIIAHEVPASQNLLAMTQRYWDTYPLRQAFSTKYAGRNYLQWEETKSSIGVATAGNTAVGRSATIHGVHASEIAFWPEPELVMLGLRQTIPSTPGTAIILESTANGMGNYFHEQWLKAEQGESEYEPLFFPWHRHPEYTAEAIGMAGKPLGELDEEERNLREMGVSDSRLLWRRYAIRDLCMGDLLKFKQEYPACVLAGTKVATTRGLVNVEDVRVGDSTPYGRVEAVHEQPPVRAVRITTKSGLQLDCTWHHPIVTASGLLLPAAASLGHDLQLADLIFAESPARYGWTDGLVQHSVQMTDDLALFAGYFMGDGYFRDGAVSVVCEGKDEDVVAEVSRSMGAVGLTPAVRVVGSKGGGREVRAAAKRLIEPFIHMGFARRVQGVGVKRHVRVPDLIWQSTREHVRLFLAGLFEADGFSNKAAWDVRLFTRYEAFARDVQRLLLPFGIHSSVYGEGNGWVVKMSGLEARAFHDHIGFRSERKRAAVPTTKPQNMRGRRLEVVSVEELGEHPSYDLSIEGRPFYGANGLLTHNTPAEAFIASGTNVFPHAELTASYDPQAGSKGTLYEDAHGVHFKPASDGPLTIWKAPSPDPDHGQYFVAGDPTRSTRGDYAVCQVINRRTLEQVAEWRGRIDPVSFASVLFNLGKFYNTAEVVTEIEGPGYSTVGALLAKNYPRIYNKTRPDRTPGKMAEDQYGWSTTMQSKHWAIGMLLRAIVDGSLTIHSAQLYNEMRNYVTLDNGGYGPATGNGREKGYDDTVMAMAIAVTCHFMSSPLSPYGAMTEFVDGSLDMGDPPWS